MSVRDILNDSLLEVRTTVTNKNEYERSCTILAIPIYMCAVFVYL